MLFASQGRSGEKMYEELSYGKISGTKHPRIMTVREAACGAGDARLSSIWRLSKRGILARLSRPAKEADYTAGESRDAYKWHLRRQRQSARMTISCSCP